MKLSEQQKQELKDLSNHRGFKVLEELSKDYEYNLLQQIKYLNLGDEENLKSLNQRQNYLKGIEDFMLTIKSSTNKMQNKKIDS